MTHGRRPMAPTIRLMFVLSLPLGLVSAASGADSDVIGDYRYAFREPESTINAQSHACSQAALAAVSRSTAFREATATIVDSPFLRKALETVTQEALKEVQIVEQFVKGNTAACTVKGRLDPQEVSKILLAQSRGPADPAQPALDQNRALRVLRVSELPDGQVLIVFQALRRLDWLSTAYQGTLRDEAEIRVEFFDDRGQVVSLIRLPARRTPAGDDVMNPGDMGTRQLAKPPGTHTFRVWVSK